MASKPGTISDCVKHDHRELEDYYNHIIHPDSDDDGKTRYQNQFVWELARHSVGEELVVYPALEKYVPNGKALTVKDRAEHQKVKEQLYKFQQMKASDPEFIPTIRALYRDLSEHIKEEEAEDLVALEDNLELQSSQDLGKSFHRTKLFVPTRSHPNAPNKPPFETVAGLLTAPLDKLMDLFKKFPE